MKPGRPREPHRKKRSTKWTAGFEGPEKIVLSRSQTVKSPEGDPHKRESTAADGKFPSMKD